MRASFPPTLQPSNPSKLSKYSLKATPGFLAVMSQPKAKMADPVVASSYFHPNGGDVYKELRQKVVMQATAMGYDVPTLTEHGVDWADDQDPFGHVGGATYSRLIYSCNFRLFESFARTLKDKYDDLYRARGVGVLTKSYSMDLRRQVTYPDSVSALSNRFSRILEGFWKESANKVC